MRRGNLTPTWLTLVMLLPLVVLAVLSWWGTQAQVRAAWAAARDEIHAVSESLANELAEGLQSARKPAQVFPDPPRPGTAAATDHLLDGTDIDALRALRNDSQAGLSPAGLPRRVLAGFRVMDLGGTSEDAAMLLMLAMGDASSVLSSRAIEKYGGDVFKKAWLRENAAREAFRIHPDVGSSGAWVFTDDVAWLADAGVSLQFLDREQVAAVLEKTRTRLPRWAGLRVVANGRKQGDADGEVMKSIAVPLGDDLRMEIIAMKPEIIEADARRQGKWAMAIFAAALLVSVVALAMMHRAMRRERQLSDMKSQFVASVSHELRAPVASIRLIADGLVKGKVEESMVGEFHRLIARESARLSALVSNVLDHSRIEQGHKVWSMRACDVKALTQETMRVMEPLAQEKGIVLQAELVEIEAVVDADAMQQALVNLLDNAIKFSPNKSAVQVRLMKHEGCFTLDVADCGPGVPDAERVKIFERFYRSGNELRRETQGTGIGLSLVKSIAEAHGGTVSVASGPDGGSIFTMNFPDQR